jgi:hypothetical protein
VLALVVEAGFDPKGTTDWEVQLPNGESFGLIAGPVIPEGALVVNRALLEEEHVFGAAAALPT